MSDPRYRANKQGELFPVATSSAVSLDMKHPLVQIANQVDWTTMEARAQRIRRKKLKNAAGKPPRLRELLGALVLMAWRKMTYRDAEDQIRHYAPARYLCGLLDSDWTPDFTTIQDFHQLMGEEGVRLLNEYVLELAVSKKLANPRMLVADTTAQEAAIPYPNEMGLMATFMTAVAVASRRAGKAFRRVKGWFIKNAKLAKRKLRHHRFFSKSKAERLKLTADLAELVAKTQGKLGRWLKRSPKNERLGGRRKVAQAKLQQLHETMTKLLPQIRHWIKTGFVVPGKIINVHIPELYSIVRGKVGKAVEFGLNWGISRLGGGFIRAKVAHDRKDLNDHHFVPKAVDDHVALFGKAPASFAYDRGGYSRKNVRHLRDRGVRNIGLAPTGRCAWEVDGRIKERLISERAQVEGCIGALKSGRYGFHRPAARSVDMMGMCGQRAALGFNLTKLIRELTKRDLLAAT